MKKITIIAAILAIAFSAFTTIENAFSPPYTYYDGTELKEVPGSVNLPLVCPTGTDAPCIVDINGPKQVYHSDGTTELWKDVQ